MYSENSVAVVQCILFIYNIVGVKYTLKIYRKWRNCHVIYGIRNYCDTDLWSFMCYITIVYGILGISLTPTLFSHTNTHTYTYSCIHILYSFPLRQHTISSTYCNCMCTLYTIYIYIYIIFKSTIFMYIRSDWIYGLFPKGFPCLLVSPLRRNAAFDARLRLLHTTVIPPLLSTIHLLFFFFPKNYNRACPWSIFFTRAFLFIIHLLRSAVKSIHHHHNQHHCLHRSTFFVFYAINAGIF